ncbi:MAG: (d)CMP kinase [Candidatus Geothermincolia bacterium]
MKRDAAVIAIDGPAGVGKSTVARSVANSLGLSYIDTGAMYRAATLAALRAGVDTGDDAAVAELAHQAKIELRYSGDDGLEVRTFLDGEDVSDDIRTPLVSSHVSQVAANPAVRRVMVGLQRELINRGGAVVEGRDVGTIVAPDADVKIFLTASVPERARRRLQDLERAGHDVTLEQLERDIARRDHLDSSRSDSPLKQAADAIVIDTTEKTAEQVTEEIVRAVRRRWDTKGAGA